MQSINGNFENLFDLSNVESDSNAFDCFDKKIYIDQDIKKIDEKNYYKVLRKLRAKKYIIKEISKTDIDRILCDSIPSVLIHGQDKIACLERSNFLIIQVKTQDNDLRLFEYFQERELESNFNSTLDADNIKNLVDLFFATENHKMYDDISKKALRNFKKIYKNFSEKLKKNTKMLNVFNETKEEFLAVTDKREFDKLIKNKLLKRFGVIKDFQIYRKNMLNFQRADEYVFPLHDQINNKLNFIYLKFSSTMSWDQDSVFILLFLDLMSEYVMHQEQLKEITAIPKLFRDVFQKIPVPIALFSIAGDLLIHNKQYSNLKLLSKFCLELSNDENVEINGETFVVKKSLIENFDNYFIYFVFTPGAIGDNSLMQVNAPNELGIISSSIAHELNNPLAGIMSAISVLEIDDHIDLESMDTLREMKQSAYRCKQLIETFLGFSKTSTSHDISLDATIHQSIDQALSLIRFRNIESGIKFHWDVHEREKFSFSKCTPAVISMIFYLIFGELLTAYSHFKLIAFQHNIKDMLLKGDFFVDSNQITIKIQTHLDFTDQLKSSRLLRHLLELEGMKMNVDTQIIRLYVSKSGGIDEC